MITDFRKQKLYLQELGKKLTMISASDENAEKKQRWANHNDLLGIQRPLIWVCPDDNGAWYELVPEESLVCDDEFLRKLELQLKKYLYHAEFFKDDFVFEPRIYLPYPGEYTGVLYGDAKQKQAWGVNIQKEEISNKAYHLNNFLKTPKDFEALLQHEVDFIPDTEEKNRLEDIFRDIFNGIIEVEFQIPYSVLVQSHLIELVHLRGLTELMLDLYDNDELLMNVLRHMGESKARLLQKLERQHMLFDNRTNIYTGSGSLGYTNHSIKSHEDVKLSDMWGFADAQEFGNVSPSMFVGFAVENQKIGLSLFGRACYGCCEPMDGKYDAVFKALPNLRRVSVSPWANIDEAVEKLGKRAIFSWKPNPAEICCGFDENEMYKKLCTVAQKTKNCYTEIILKDIRTCGGTSLHLEKFAAVAAKAFW